MNNEKQLAAFMAKKEQIDLALSRLQELSDNHFNKNPDLIGWGDLADLDRISLLIKESSDISFNEGEYK